MQKPACKIAKAMKAEVAASLRYSEASRTTEATGVRRRSAAKAMHRANKFLERDTPGVWTPTQTKKIKKQVAPLIRTLYSGGEEVDPRTIAKTKALLDDLGRMAKKC